MKKEIPKMNMKTTDFQVVTSLNVYEMCDDVNKALKLGWKLHGQLVVVCTPNGYFSYIQAMIKEAPSSEGGG
jgi:hypothetical protein